MKTTIELVGIIITLPFIALEAVIKVIMFILYFPLVLYIALLYPILKHAEVLDRLKEWYNYSTKWKNGFITGPLYKLWEVD